VGWLIAATFALGLLMVHAMMEFTIALRWPGKRAQGGGMDARALRERLLRLNERAQGWQIVPHPRADLEPRWDIFHNTPVTDCDRVRLTSRYRTWILLDEERREARIYEHIHSSSFFLGMLHGGPKFNRPHFFAGPMEGPPWSGLAYCVGPGFFPDVLAVHAFSFETRTARLAIERAVKTAGWTVRPVVLWFQALRGPFRFFRALVPRPLRHWPSRRFWGILYPLSFFSIIGFILWWTGGPANLDAEGWLALAIVCAGWWLVWGIIAWVIARGIPLRPR
jgi:hypothetical protein